MLHFYGWMQKQRVKIYLAIEALNPEISKYFIQVILPGILKCI